MPNLRTSMALLGAAALVAGVSACQQYEHKDGGNAAASNAAAVDTSAIADAIKADEEKWSGEFQAKPRSLDALVAHYAADAHFIAPGVKPTSGMADIRKTYEEALKDPNFNITFAADKVAVAASGDLAYATGRFTETYTDPATKQSKSDEGSFVTIYRKQDDGSWKAVEDWAVADPAAPVAPAAQ